MTVNPLLLHVLLRFHKVNCDLILRYFLVFVDHVILKCDDTLFLFHFLVINDTIYSAWSFRKMMNLLISTVTVHFFFFICPWFL